MDIVAKQLLQLKKDAAIIQRIEKKREKYALGLAIAVFVAVPGLVGILAPALLFKTLGVTCIVSGLLFGIFRCSF